MCPTTIELLMPYSSRLAYQVSIMFCLSDLNLTNEKDNPAVRHSISYNIWLHVCTERFDVYKCSGCQ